MVESKIYRKAKANTGRSALEDLFPALKRLDDLLERAVVVARKVYGEQAVRDPFRGLYISEDEAFRLLRRKPANPLLYHKSDQNRRNIKEQDCEVTRLQWLKQIYNLSPFDLDLILITLAPELDLKYERLYAYLQDDVTRKRPTVDLALNLLCTTREEKVEKRNHFASDAPLIQQRFLHLIPDPNHTEPPLPSHYLKLDDQLVRFLLGNEGLDSRLTPFCQILKPKVSFKELPLNDEIKKALPAMVNQAREERRALGLYFQGPTGAGKRQSAKAIASKVGTPLLVAEMLRLVEGEPDFDHVLMLLFREARFQNAILFLNGVDLLFSDVCVSQYCRLLDILAREKGITILGGAKPWVPSGHVPTGVITVRFAIPDFSQRKIYWQNRLEKTDTNVNVNNLDLLAGRFCLRPGQIADAAMIARNIARWRASKELVINSSASKNGQPTIDDLFAAARFQTGHDLATLARKIEPSYIWDDIVLPEDTITQLHEICQWVTYRYRVLGEWGFNEKLSMGKGVNALFAGPTGTGKTMAAEIIANELGLELYKIDLAGVVSKYIGETEKNLDRIFHAAENANVILLFDEADALFGKRSEVRDSHDRYANIEINYLLQKMEEYEGIAILASNLRQNLDESFMRRMAFTVHFPFPDDASRERIWAGIWPSEIPLSDDMDFGLLAHQFKLSGGNVKNIALAAAFLAADDGGSVKMSHLLQATRREYQKMGKNLSEAELYGNQIESQ